MRRAKLRQRRPWITFREQDGTGRVSGEGIQVRGVEPCGDPGKFIGRHPRGSDVLGLDQDLDTSGNQA
jgi:hypothetical protein